MKIVVLDGLLVAPADTFWEPIAKQGAFSYYESTSDALLLERIKDATAIFSNRVHISGAVMAQCPALRFIGCFGTGYNQVDTDSAKNLGICVCNVPNYSTSAVSQLAIALLLEICCRTSFFDSYIKQGRWVDAVDRTIAATRMRELSGMTMGIIGFGSIGQATAKTAQALGMSVLAYKRTPDLTLQRDTLHFADLDTVLQQADVVSLHCALNDQTRGMIGEGALARMKDGAILINTARGGLLEDTAVAAALDSGKLYAAGLDVFSPEPAGSNHQLASHPRCIATPHVGWAPEETRKRLIAVCGENLACYLAGHPQNRIV